MTKINPRLFAHIQNDSSLAGTFELEGDRFANTAHYLKEYIEELTKAGEVFPKVYTQILAETDYLVTIEQETDAIIKGEKPITHCDDLAKKIHQDILNLPIDGKLLLPGGWVGVPHGHAMIYQIVRTADGYDFLAINSGAGLSYHAKKSSTDKELYNPIKKWHFTVPKENKESWAAETQIFIKHLIEARLPPLEGKPKIQTNEHIHYLETLGGITRIGGVEVDPNIGMKEHAYTASQISGTCSQRSLHQMLKINTDKADDYKCFIFKFKLHALHEYTKACFANKHPFNKGVALQIKIAIENNLKILNTLPLKEEDIKKYAKELTALKITLNEKTALIKEKAVTKDTYPEPNLTIWASNHELPKMNTDTPAYEAVDLIPINLNNGTNLLNNLEDIIKKLELIKDTATQYRYLEQILLELSIYKPPNPTPFYKELRTLQDFLSFEKKLNKIDDLLKAQHKIKTPTPTVNVMTLSLMSMLIDTHQIINQFSGLPNNNAISEPLITALIGAHSRDPFWATNNPIFDEKFVALQERYNSRVTKKEREVILNYYKGIISKDPVNKELERIYSERYGADGSSLQKGIRQNMLHTVFILSEMIDETIDTPAECLPLVNQMKIEFAFASRVRECFNRILGQEESAAPQLKIIPKPWADGFYVQTPFYFEPLVGTGCNHNPYNTHKYLKVNEAAADALISDTRVTLSYSKNHEERLGAYTRDANTIQLYPSKGVISDNSRHISQKDIMARDYHHLRGVELLQIPLTLDYFTRTISLLATQSNQDYVEANIFQPGLLSQAAANPAFLPQLDEFLTTGIRYYTYQGQHTANSLFFLRLNYQISRFLALMPANPPSTDRLKALQKELAMQIQVSTSPDITYVLQQTLFLNLMTQLELGADPVTLFPLAQNAYFYIESHANPLLFDDPALQMELHKTKAFFQQLTGRQPEKIIVEGVKQALTQSAIPLPNHQLKGKYPVYQLVNAQGKTFFEFNAHLGKLFDESGLAQADIPLSIQNNSLLKHLGLDKERQCLISADKQWLKIPPMGNSITFYHEVKNESDRLTACQNWTINNKLEGYQLSALSNHHEARKANYYVSLVRTNLPKVLTDGSMDYWSNSLSSIKGILVHNRQPIYSITSGVIKQLDAKGVETDYELKPLSSQQINQLNSFESSDFLVHHSGPTDSVITLPRYALTFTQAANSETLIHQQTGEHVVADSTPIHPAVATLVLENEAKLSRCLIPIARFYASKEKAQVSDFYPVVHDINGTIAEAHFKRPGKYDENKEKSMWHYHNSEHYASYQLKNGEPIAETAADALYLAYIYLSTNQTEKAWKTLEQCTTSFGGLSGKPEELKYISWIINELPHILPDSKLEEASKKTPPFIACQLKAMALLSTSLAQGRVFDLKEPSTTVNTLNSKYDLDQYQQTNKFLKDLPETIYKSFQAMQKARRHLESTYTLSPLERKYLLNYYHQSQSIDDAPMGALGYEWMSLNLDTILKEEQGLLASQKIGALLPADKKRLEFIKHQLKQLKAVTAVSTELELRPIDLVLPEKVALKEEHISYETRISMHKGEKNLPAAALGDKKLTDALKELLSDRKDDTFFSHFPAYVEIALSSNEEYKKKLRHFCTTTLIAQRHVPLMKQTSNIPFLCNILYRLLENSSLANRQLGGRSLQFEKLVDMVKAYKITPLKIYQAHDVYKNILATPEQLSQQRPLVKPLINPKLESQTLMIQTGIPSFLSPAQSTQLNSMIKECRSLQEESSKSLKALGLIKNKEQQLIEEEAGLLRLKLVKAINKIAHPFINDSEFTQSILDALTKTEKKFSPEVEKAWEAALTFANQGPKSPVAARKWAIEVAANTRSKLTKADLQALYSRADTALSIEKTGLTPEDCQKLQELTHLALVQGIQRNWLNKIKSNLETGIKDNDVSAAALALELLTRNEIPSLDYPATVLIQHEQNIILHHRQVASLKAILEPPSIDTGKPFNELIDKTIPGGGKSKVILPIIAEKKANGSNLVVIEVPRALLATNFVDLNRESQRLFGKSAYRFEFNRHSDCSPKSLKQYYELFREIITTKSYLVTCGEAIQSLELKYLELLTQGDSTNKEWKEQIFWLDKITNLFRHQADCIIDEAHKGLSPKDKLNSTIGVALPINGAQIRDCIALFNLIDLDFIKKAPSFKPDYDWTPFKNQLAERLIKDPRSPLAQFILKAHAQYGVEIDNILITYLTNQAESLHEVITLASPEQKAALALFKQEINIFLPQTLPRKLGVHYGSSQLKGLTPLEKTLPIPYEGNDIPNERSRFGNPIETSNYLVQMMLLKGISKELNTEQIVVLQGKARDEMQKKSITDVDETQIAQGLALLAPQLGLKFSKINLDNPNHTHSLHKALQHNRVLIDELLEPALNQIKKDEGILHSDSFNHVDLYRTTQAVTGTPNPTTYHQRLTFDKTASLGTDGFVINTILDKKTPTMACDCNTINQFLEQVLTASNDHKRCHAIIDINATFTGQTNDKVATELAAFTLKHPERFSKTIKHILYFNRDNVLCALKPDSPQEPIIIGTSDPEEINRILGSTPDERFTYYDQVHTVGVDIKQDKKSHALVLVDDKTSLQSFIQGTMRMRELALEQTLELIVPEQNKGLDCKQLIQKFADNDENELNNANLVVAKDQLANLLRSNLLTRIQELPSENAEEKALLSKHFKPFFIDIPSDDLFALYGGLSKEQATTEILNNSATQLLTLWQTCLQNAGISSTQEEYNATRAALTKIITNALPHCLSHYEATDDSLSSRVEIQNEIQKQVQVELQTTNEFYNTALIPAYISDWTINDRRWGYVQEDLPLSPLNKLCAIEESTPLFSPQLQASTNYSQTYQYQAQMLGAYLKPVFLIWYKLDGNNKLHATIITPQEVENLRSSKAYGNFLSWISTTQDTVVEGKRPKDIHLSEEYQSLREQVRFFNGEFNLLAEQKTPLLWLKEKPEEKIKFYGDKLLPYRPHSTQSFGLMKASLNQNDLAGFNYIVAHPFADLTQFDWRTLNSKLMDSQINQYQKLAQVFNYLNTHLMTLPEDSSKIITELQAQYQLPISTLSYVNTHLENLLQFKKITTGLTIPAEKPFLLNEPINSAFFKDYLGIPIDFILKKYGIDQPAGNDLTSKQLLAYQLASMQLLLAVRPHPMVADKKPFDQAILTMAKKTNSVEMLQLLAEISGPSEELLKAILKNPVYNSSITSKILQLANEGVLIELVDNFPDSKELISAVVIHPQCSGKVLEVLIEKDLLTASLANTIIQQQSTLSDDVLNTINEIIFTQYISTQPNSSWENAFKTLLSQKKSSTAAQQIIPKFVQEHYEDLEESSIKLNELIELGQIIDFSDENGDSKFTSEQIINSMTVLVKSGEIKEAHNYLLLIEIGAVEEANQQLSSVEISDKEVDALKKKCDLSIETIKNNSWGSDDILTNDYCEAMQDSIDNINDNDDYDSMSAHDKFVFLSFKLKQLTAVQAAVSSEEMKLLRIETERLKKGSTGFFGGTYRNKVNEINKAVVDVPLEKRLHIFSNESDPQCNSVRQAVALRRNSPFSALDDEGHVNPDKAARSFQNISKTLQKNREDSQEESLPQITKK